MKRLFSQMALTFALVAMLTFLIGSTASAQSTLTTHRTSTAAISVSLACPPTISEGSGGAAVVTLQQALNKLYRDFADPSWWENSPQNAHPPLSVDGSFGPLTRAAVIDFQYWNSLTQDGIVGPNTWHVLHKC
jgi:peptidoglycan hydrolase-like protein with peptidoglycan-binding domain